MPKATALSLAEICLDSGSEQQAQVNRIVDEHVQWLLAFHRLAFYRDIATSAAEAIAGKGSNGYKATDLPMPKSFVSWFRGTAQRLPAEQSTIDRLAVLHDQLHKFAKMMVQKAEGDSGGTKKQQPMPAIDYEMVMTRYADFMQALRRFERGFSAASAGLDLLTGLRSRFTLASDLAAEQKRMARSGQPLSLALCDLDHFREIGALHGAETPDRTLTQVGEAINNAIRTYDDAYRIEGSIFLICLKGAKGGDAAVVIERLRGRVAASPVRLFGGGTLAITAAFGVIEAKANEALPDLLTRLETCLHTAQDNGGNKVEFATG